MHQTLHSSRGVEVPCPSGSTVTLKPCPGTGTPCPFAGLAAFPTGPALLPGVTLKSSVCREPQLCVSFCLERGSLVRHSLDLGFTYWALVSVLQDSLPHHKEWLGLQVVTFLSLLPARRRTQRLLCLDSCSASWRHSVV